MSVAVRRAIYGKLAGDTTLNTLLATPPSGCSISAFSTVCAGIDQRRPARRARPPHPHLQRRQLGLGQLHARQLGHNLAEHDRDLRA